MTPLLTVRQASAAYPVYVGAGLLDRTGSLVRPRGKVFVITSSPLRALYGERVARSFSPAAEILEMEEGEENKTLATAEWIATQLIERGARRDSTAVAVGGGMIGDTAGFAASILMRGIDLVHVPTTLLAQLDSSIGGKTAVNHPRGKNLIGSFHAPRAVLADTGVLGTLPRRELVGGIYEAIKCGVVADPDLFALLETRREAILSLEPPAVEDVVRRSVRVKADIVSADEREGGLRRLLNYGHTIGHAIEAATGFRLLLHGEAVAWGMIAANAVAVGRGLLPAAVAERINRCVMAWGPPEVTIDPDAVLRAAGYDKKNRQSARVMVLPESIGECAIVEDITEDDLRRGIEAVRPRG